MLQSPPFPAAPAVSRASDSAAVLERVQAICRDQVAPYAAEVDRDARFPREAFAALREERLLAAYVPAEHGGLGLGIAEISQICETLGRACGSTGLIFAMHQIQVACIVHHALGAPWFRDYVRELAAEQHLLASATTEMGVGGDLRSSICAAVVQDGRFTLTKQAPVISYGEAADAILATCRSSEASPRSDQALVLARRKDYRLERLSGWDTLGMRGTCSCGFVLHAAGDAAQILPVPYAQIHARTMHPFAHLVWASVWVGIASDAIERARALVRAEARKSPGNAPVSAMRLAEADLLLFAMRASVQQTVVEYQRRLLGADADGASHLAFAVRVNNLKVGCAQQLVEVVGRAMVIGGIAAYKNDSKLSLTRHLRDAWGACVMVNNDRILGLNAAMHIIQPGQG